MGLAEEIARGSGGGVEVLYGTIASVQDTSVTVYVGGNLVADCLLAAPGYLPLPDDPVVVLRHGSRITVLSAIVPPYPPRGTVQALPDVSTDLVNVTVAGFGNVRLPFMGNYTPAVSDLVQILWRGTLQSGLILGEVGDADVVLPPSSPPTAPPSGPSSGTTTFTATGVGTYRSGWRNDDNGDVIQGTAPGYPGANEGAWFYSGHIRGTLGGATVTGAEIWLGRGEGGVFASQTANLQRVAHDTRPGGAMTFTGSVTGVGLAVGQSGWLAIPTALAQSLVDSGGSIGVKGSPYMRLHGLSRSGSAGALRISWRR